MPEGAGRIVGTNSPKVFLCHASEDKSLARRIAEDFQRAEIDTFYAEWSIVGGDSIPQRIDAGLRSCTHFVVLLTENSVERPWVKTEIDAGFIRMVEGQSKFLPLRHNLPLERLPPLLRTRHAPELTRYDQDIHTIIGEIYGISRKPPLGERPTFTQPPVKRPTGLSSAAARIAAEIVGQSKVGREGDPAIRVEELLASTGLTEQDFEVAVDELERRFLVKPLRATGCPPLGYYAVEAIKYIFIDLDLVFMNWSPRKDAVRIAVELLNSECYGLSSEDVSVKLGWTPRRMNPALAYLIHQGAVIASRNIDATFVTVHIEKNNRTRAFVREHS
jgi:hypothetical protein